MVLNYLQHPEDNLRDVATPVCVYPKKQFLDCEGFSCWIVYHQDEIHLTDQNSGIGVPKVFQRFFVVTAVTKHIDVDHSERVDKAGGRIDNTVRNFPVDVNYRPVQVLFKTRVGVFYHI